MQEVTKKSISKLSVENKLKQLFEKNLSKLYKIKIMYILGDIGNTETKLCIVSKNNKISKKITFLSKSINNKQLK